MHFSRTRECSLSPKQEKILSQGHEPSTGYEGSLSLGKEVSRDKAHSYAAQLGLEDCTHERDHLPQQFCCLKGVSHSTAKIVNKSILAANILAVE